MGAEVAWLFVVIVLVVCYASAVRIDKRLERRADERENRKR